MELAGTAVDESDARPAPRPGGRLIAPDPGSVVGLVPCHAEPPPADLLAALAGRLGGVLVVDDGMPAPAGRRLRGMVGGRVRALHLPRNRGKGHALAAGIHHLLSSRAVPAAVLVMDSDGQHPAAAVTDFLRAAGHAELVIGDRFADPGGGMPVVRRIANRASSRLLSVVTGASVRDGQCGMRLLAGRALHEIPVPPGGYESETVHLKRCLRAGVSVEWVPIPAIYEGAPSSFRAVRDSVRVVAAAVR